MGAGIHGTAEGRITAVDHFINVFHFRFSGMEGIFNFFIIVGKNFLKYIHESIMTDREGKRKPQPLKCRRHFFILSLFIKRKMEKGG